ncbi:MAG TPA: hypothetical protein OIL92_00300 [Oscillospiraceae bacterium]|nr:hypothetical protein [Oscillospiraceae bacterium]
MGKKISCRISQKDMRQLLSGKFKKQGRTAFARWVKNVKGFALKTHEGLRPSTLQAFEKA